MVKTRELIEQARSREAALAQVASLMAQARGSAHAVDGSVEVTVDALGSLKRLWLAHSVAERDPSRVSALVLEVVRVAMAEAEQDCYNRVGLLLGEEAGLLVEALSGRAAPARSADDDPGMTVEEFQRLRAERVGERRFPPHHLAVESTVEDGWEGFDPASLRSDR
ncbi:YbaB/EbfC family nucleoid-associated protein [Amycolatopsis orientalis]|uniref:YbaB/EbfC family nucleoid-associated protein n=1 Tax=Amycolatopsis orientalis TaxID=31958 RepID=UPI0003A4D9D4|nr:YbaB/EbfC family nucleoid-associated protein [Amycolatopsis orientalis]